MGEWQGADQGSVLSCAAAGILALLLLVDGCALAAQTVLVVAVQCFLQSTNVKYIASANRMKTWDMWWILTPSRAESTAVLVLVMLVAGGPPRAQGRLATACSYAGLVGALRVADRYSSGTVGPVGAAREALLSGLSLGSSLIQASDAYSIEVLVGVVPVVVALAVIYAQGEGLVSDTADLRVAGGVFALICGEAAVISWDVGHTRTLYTFVLAALCVPGVHALNVFTVKYASFDPQVTVERVFGKQSEDAQSVGEQNSQEGENDENENELKRLLMALSKYAVPVLVGIVWYSVTMAWTHGDVQPALLGESHGVDSGQKQLLVYFIVVFLGSFCGFNRLAAVLTAALILADPETPGLFCLVGASCVGFFLWKLPDESCYLRPVSGALFLIWFRDDRAVASDAVFASLALGLVQLFAASRAGGTPYLSRILHSATFSKALWCMLATAWVLWLYDSRATTLVATLLTVLVWSLSRDGLWLGWAHLLFFNAAYSLLQRSSALL